MMRRKWDEVSDESLVHRAPEEHIDLAEAVRLLVRARYPNDRWVEEIRSDDWVHRGSLDPDQISTVRAAIQVLCDAVKSGTFRVRGEIDGRVSDFVMTWPTDRFWRIDSLDIFGSTLTVSSVIEYPWQ